MSYAEMFARIDVMEGNTLIVFDNVDVANAYVAHQASRGVYGMICRREDTRTGSGLLVQWRDPVPSAEAPRRLREALWLLEEVLAGRAPRPKPGMVCDISPEVEERRVASLKERD